MSNTTAFDRRRFLTGAAGTAAAAVGGPSLLAACSTGSSGGSGQNGQTVNQVKLPSYIPYTGVKADLPGDAQGALDGWLHYPNPPKQVFNSPPGHGGTVSAFVLSSSPAPPALGQNPYWQELNRRLGVNLQLDIVPSSDGPVKFATLIAGNDLPDLIVPALTTPSGIAQGAADFPQWLKAKCQDLTPYLVGDNIKQYPFLANIPTESWKTTRYNGGIYGVPIPRGILGNLMMRRDDIFQQMGVNPQPGSFSEFRQICQQLTNASQNRWALTSATDALNFIVQMLGVGPQVWGVRDGKFVRDLETPEFKQALSEAAQMVKDGLVHPDSFASTAPVKQWFGAGNSVLHGDRYTAWPQYYQEQTSGPAFQLGGMRPPKHDGGGFANTYQLGFPGAINNITAFKKADDARIRELLAICNWLAAPFGTEEYLFRKYGLPGVDYTFVNGQPNQTQAGVSQTALGVRYIADAPDTLFVPGNAKATQALYDYQKQVLPTSVPDASSALYSDTWARKQGQLGTLFMNAQNDVLSGRQPVSSWDDTVKQWRQAGGDQARAEFEAAAAASK